VVCHSVKLTLVDAVCTSYLAGHLNLLFFLPSALTIKNAFPHFCNYMTRNISTCQFRAVPRNTI
jgi:hypothetical protein